MARPKFEFIDVNGNAAGLTDPGANNTTLGGGSDYSVVAHNSKHYRNNNGILQLIHNQTDFKNVIAPYAANNSNTAWTYTSLDSNVGTLTSTDANPVTLYGLIQAIKADITYLNNNKGYHKTGSWSGLTYTATDVGTGQALAFTIPTGTSATTVAAGNHTHGYISNDGKITHEVNLGNMTVSHFAVTDSDGKVYKATTSQAESLLNLGTAAHADVASGVDATAGLPTIAQVKSLISTATAGLSGAMHFIGSVSNGTVTDGGTQSPTVGGYSGTVKTTGNVVLFGNQEFIWNGSAWELLGDEGSYALKTTTVTGSGSLDGGGALSQNQVITHKAGNAASTTTGFYKFSTDGCSHINSVTAVTKADITGLGIPGADTHYTAVPVIGGSSATSNATSATSDPYLNIVENSAKSGGVQFKAGTGISVSGNGGVVTITNSSPNSHNNHGVTVVSGLKADGSTNISASSTQSQSGLHSVTLGDSGVTVDSTSKVGTYSALTVNAKGIVVGGYVSIAYGATLNDCPTNLVDGGTFYVVD